MLGFRGASRYISQDFQEAFAMECEAMRRVRRIRTESSFHIFKVDERRPPGAIDLQTAAPVIRERLRENQIRDGIAQTVTKSKAEIQIAVLTKRLPFKYTGTLPKSEND